MPLDLQPLESEGLDLQPIKDTSVSTLDLQPIGKKSSLLTYLKEHPFKSILQPLPKTLGGKTPKEKIVEKFATKPEGERWLPAYGRAVTAGITGDITDILTTPATYIPLPIGKVIGKIPIKGTTLGEIVKTIPIGRGFMKGVEELGRYEQTLKRITPLSSRGMVGKTTENIFITKGRIPIKKEYTIDDLGKINSDIKNLSQMLPPLRRRGLTEEDINIENKLRELLNIQKNIFSQFEQKRIIPTAKDILKRRIPEETGGVVKSSFITTTQPTELTPIQKIIQALKEAKPIRGKQEALYSAERAKRAGAISGIGQQVPGEAGYHAQLGALKGELPKVQFEGIRGKISQPDIDSLFNTIEQHQILSPFEKITTKNGLAKLLSAEGGTVPTKGELKLLGEVFPQDFINTVLTKRPLLQKAGEGIAEVLNVPRALMASFDMSAPLRQGVFLIGRPKQWMPAFRDMFKYFFSEKSYQGLMSDIQKRPTYSLIRESRLPLTDIGATLAGREEKFMSNLAEKIPLVGKVVKASNRAYTGFLNKLRVDVFDDLVNTAQKQGIKVEGKVLGDIAKFVGSATGRGDLGILNNAAVALNSVFFSPRLMASRLNLLNPVYYTKLDPFVRKEALKSLFTFSGTASSILGLAKLGGADIGVDSRSADFGKIKIGNTRYDILGGFQQYLRIAGQLITGEHISSTTGVKTTLGEGYKPLTRFDIALRFLETKEAPVASFATALLKGQSALGQKLEVGKEVGQRFVPMVIQDMYDLVKERGLEGVGMSIPAIFGVGVQTYAPTAQEMVYSANSVLTHYKELLKQGNIEEARGLLNKNREIIRIGKMLEPTHKQL